MATVREVLEYGLVLELGEGAISLLHKSQISQKWVCPVMQHYTVIITVALVRRGCKYTTAIVRVLLITRNLIHYYICVIKG